MWFVAWCWSGVVWGVGVGVVLSSGFSAVEDPCFAVHAIGAPVVAEDFI